MVAQQNIAGEVKLKTYHSISEIIHDVPLQPVIVSIIIATAPLILYYFCNRPVVRTYFANFTAFLKPSVSRLYGYIERRNLEDKVRKEFEQIAGKKIGLKQIVKHSFNLSIILFTVLILKKTFFFALVISQSMLPTLAVQDLVLIESLTTENIEVGDIVLFTAPGTGTEIIHRVYSVEDGRIRTIGDNIGRPDGWALTNEDIKGKAVLMNGKPIVIKNIGGYFISTEPFAVAVSDPTFRFIRASAKAVHAYGPIIIIIFLMMSILSTFKRY